MIPFDQSNTGANTDRPNVIADPNTGPRTSNQWFNISAFEHPATGAPLDVRSPWPGDLRRLLTRLGLHRPDLAPQAQPDP